MLNTLAAGVNFIQDGPGATAGFLTLQRKQLQTRFPRRDKSGNDGDEYNGAGYQQEIPGREFYGIIINDKGITA